MGVFLGYGKISLRPLEPEDIDLLYLWENSLETWQVSQTKTPFARHILTDYILNSHKDIYELKQLRLIISDVTRNPVGAIDLFDFDPYNLRAGVGILIYHPGSRRKGYATDALVAIAGYAKDVLGLKQLYASVAEDNIASRALFEKNGYEISGTKKCWLKHPEGWKDELFYQKILW